jgi:hypothetical protein
MPLPRSSVLCATATCADLASQPVEFETLHQAAHAARPHLPAGVNGTRANPPITCAVTSGACSITRASRWVRTIERRAAGQHRIMTADLPTERHDPSDRFAQTEGVVVPRGFTNVRLTVRHPPQQGLLPPPPGPRAGHRLQRPGRRAQRTPVPRSRLRRLLVHPRGPDPGPATSRRPRRHIRREPSRTRPPQPAGQLRRGTAPRGRTPGRGGFTRSH